jgi:hypothetical protein
VVAANGFWEQRNTNACRGGVSRNNAYGCAITRQSNAHSRCVDSCNCRFARAYASEYARARSITHSNISAFSDTSVAKLYANKLANSCAHTNTNADPGNPPPKNADATRYGCGNACCNCGYHGPGNTHAPNSLGNSGSNHRPQTTPNQPAAARYSGAAYTANYTTAFTTAFTTHTTTNFATSSGNTTTAQPNNRATADAATCAHHCATTHLTASAH